MRSLYQCFNAKVNTEGIYCACGYKLTKGSHNGYLHISYLERGTPLEYGVCQHCNDFDCMGEPIPKKERGWYDILDM